MLVGFSFLVPLFLFVALCGCAILLASRFLWGPLVEEQGKGMDRAFRVVGVECVGGGCEVGWDFGY